MSAESIGKTAFSGRVPARREAGFFLRRWKPVAQNRLKPCRGTPFHLLGVASRRSILSGIEHESLLALPDNQDDLIRHYTFSESTLSVVRQHRGAANCLHFAADQALLHALSRRDTRYR